MAISKPFAKSVKLEYLDTESPSEERDSGCVLANLMRQSLSMYIELEKTHWHLRLNSADHADNFESAGPMEVAREVCTISLQLISSISRLQRVLEPNVNPDCAALSAAVQEKFAEVCELSSERRSTPQSILGLLFQGLNAFRDTRLPENANLF